MQFEEIVAEVSKLPQTRVGFYPTPLHEAENILCRYGVENYLKREDLAVAARQAELEGQGHRVVVVPAAAAHPASGWCSCTPAMS
ncbi:hypothetical protein [Acuticoccus sediminis]|uniref:hypothetical protein n=1 Tax=Acuticoccus sediminis TaxID=2184697 RepID=UPI001CFE1B80|nr:hypothetical protein [Acuticoccus sediminis]